MHATFYGNLLLSRIGNIIPLSIIEDFQDLYYVYQQEKSFVKF